jgi:hypothetical protein
MMRSNSALSGKGREASEITYEQLRHDLAMDAQ